MCPPAWWRSNRGSNWSARSTWTSSGEGSCSLVFAASGVIPLKAVYPGDTSFLPGVSDVLDLEVMDLNGDILFYRHDFETSAGSEWCLLRQDITPTGRGFLGQFSNETACLLLKDIPTAYLAEGLLRSISDPLLERQPGNLEAELAERSRSSRGQSLLESGLGGRSGPLPCPGRWARLAGNYLCQLSRLFRRLTREAIRAGFTRPRPAQPRLTHLVITLTTGPMDSVYHLTFVLQHSSSQLAVGFQRPGFARDHQ